MCAHTYTHIRTHTHTHNMRASYRDPRRTKPRTWTTSIECLLPENFVYVIVSIHVCVRLHECMCFLACAIPAHTHTNYRSQTQTRAPRTFGKEHAFAVGRHNLIVYIRIDQLAQGRGPVRINPLRFENFTIHFFL